MLVSSEQSRKPVETCNNVLTLSVNTESSLSTKLMTDKMDGLRLAYFQHAPMLDNLETYVSSMKNASTIGSTISPLDCLKFTKFTAEMMSCYEHEFDDVWRRDTNEKHDSSSDSSSPSIRTCQRPAAKRRTTRRKLLLDVTNTHTSCSQTTFTRHNTSQETPKRSQATPKRPSESPIVSTSKYRRRFTTSSIESPQTDSSLSSCLMKRLSLSHNKSQFKDIPAEEPSLNEKTSLAFNDVEVDLLPTIPGKVADVTSINAETMADVLSGRLHVNADVTIVDCRYPYEYDGGHITGAINLFTKEEVTEHFFPPTGVASDRRHMIIFHCEFSSERGPKMYRHLRQHDRHVNAHRYPHLSYPDIYLLDSGYSSFYPDNKVLCSPNGYTSMFHQDYKQDLKKFRVKSKSFPIAKSRRQNHSDVRIALNF